MFKSESSVIKFSYPFFPLLDGLFLLFVLASVVSKPKVTIDPQNWCSKPTDNKDKRDWVF